MKFPKPIQKQMKLVEGLTAIWAEEDAEYAVRQHALAKAKTADSEALKAAAIAGELDPGTKDTDVAARALVYQEERVKAAGRAVSKESQVLMTLFREHRLELFAEACEVAGRTVETFRRDIAEVAQRVTQIKKAREQGLAPLRWVASLTDGSLSYDPSFPMQGSFQLPKTAEQKALGIIALLRRFYLEDNPDVA
jgi:negative regulator of replication initiation